MMKFILLFTFLYSQAIAQTGSGAGITQFVKNNRIQNVIQDDVTPANSVPLPVSFSASGGLTVEQGDKGTIAESWYVHPCDGTNCQSFLGTGEGKVSVTQALPTGANVIGGVTQSGTWSVGRTWSLSSGTDSVSATVSSSALPTGAATSANQSTEITKLTSIDNSLANIDINTDATMGSVGSIDTKTPALVSGRVPVDGSGVTQPISAAALPLPSGASTAAKQPALGTAGTASADVISVQGIASMTPLLVNGSGVTQPVSIAASVQTKAPLNTSGSGSAAAATVSTVVTLTKPANAVGFVLMNLDTSTANIRWALGRTATTTLGQQLQPGRDTGFIPASVDISLVSESGTQNYDVQWVSQ